MSARTLLGLATIVLSVLTLLATADTGAAQRKREKAAAPAPQQGDKRDRVVAAPGTPFHGKAYWQAAAQCGGLYFKLGSIYSDSAIQAKVVRPDPAAHARLSSSANAASRAATAFFEAAERFLIADRKLARDEAVMTYDPVATSSGDRAKTLDAGLQAAQPCPGLYQSCRTAFPQICNDAQVLTN